MIEDLINYIKDEEFVIKVWNNKINIVNFKEIIILEEEKIVVTSPNKKTIIRGTNLSINKLLDNEILVSGDFTSIEFGI